MIRGTVNYSNEAIVPLRVRGPSGTELDIDAVIDTGYSGALTLPSAVVSALNLPLCNQVTLRLGDGTTCQCDTYNIEVEWDGVWRKLVATEVDSNPLLGVGLLARHEVFIEFIPHGVVDVTRLP